MPQVRVDPLTGLKTIIAGDRADPERDPFAPGHEDQTPPEVYAVRPNGGAPNTPGWTVRAVPNKYPALDPDAATPEPNANPDLFTAQAAAGAHEVIVNAPESVTSLSDLSVEQVARAVEAWRAGPRAPRDAGGPPQRVKKPPRGGWRGPRAGAPTGMRPAGT